MEETQVESTINLQELFGLLWKNIIFIGIVTLIATVGTGLFTTYLITEKYESTTLISVTKEDTDETPNASSDVFRYGTELAKRYSIIATSNSVLTEVHDKLKSEHNLEIKKNIIKNSVEVVSVNETDILRITVKYTDADTAQTIADLITDVSKNIYQTTYEDAEIKIIDHAEVNNNPVSPNINLNIIIGFVLGLMIGIGIVLLREFLDRTIKDEKDVEKYLNLPVVGNIPLFEKSYLK